MWVIQHLETGAYISEYIKNDVNVLCEDLQFARPHVVAKPTPKHPSCLKIIYPVHKYLSESQAKLEIIQMIKAGELYFKGESLSIGSENELLVIKIDQADKWTTFVMGKIKELPVSYVIMHKPTGFLINGLSATLTLGIVSPVLFNTRDEAFAELCDLVLINPALSMVSDLDGPHVYKFGDFKVIEYLG